MNQYTGGQYLMIDIANQYGLDKLNFEPRIQWVVDHENDLEALAPKADDYFRYQAAVMAYRDAQDGNPTGHLVGLDACASGLQIMGAMTGCPITAKNTGLIGQDRMDIYSETTKVMNTIMDGKITVPRSDVKDAQMTHFYGSKARPKAIFGPDTHELRTFYAAQSAVAPGAVKLRDALLLSWQPGTLRHAWTLPDGFRADIAVTQTIDKKIEVDELDHASFIYRFTVNKGTKEGLSIAANPIHSIDGFIVREICRRCNYTRKDLLNAEHLLNMQLLQKNTTTQHLLIEQAWRQTGFISLAGINFLDSIYHMSKEYIVELLALVQETLNRPTFEVLTVHDEFKCHANYMNTLRQTYIEIFAELAESTLMQSILTEINGRPVKVNKIDPNLGDLIRQGEYALS